MAQGHNNNTVGGSEQLIPTKDTLTALKSDVTRESAIKELIDNALDAHQRNSARTEPVTIKVYGEEAEDHTELVIWDDTGGVPRSEAKMVFTLGMTAKDQGGLIGTFGLGAKKALVNLGVPFTIASHHEEDETGWQYTIDRDWLEDDEDWSVEVEPRDDLAPGETEIRVHDLAYNWFEPDQEEDEDSDGLEVPLPYEDLRDDLARTYNWFLSNELYGHDHDITIEVQGERVEPVGLPDWAFSPFDGMHPRRFENIPINIEGMAPTRLHITVGLLRKQDADVAGIDVYCQHRLVLDSARDERVGVGGRGSLGNWTQHNNRLKAIVELETDGDAQDLPWDTQKSNLDRHNPIMREARDWIRRAVQDYFDLNTGVVPRAFIEFYPPGNPYAANDGEIDTHDYSTRKRVMHHPDVSLPQLSDLVRTVKAHAALDFRCERGLEDWQIPAYKGHLTSVANVEAYEQLPELTVEPVELDESKADDYARDLEMLAEAHFEAGIKYADDLLHWQVPKYEAHLEALAKGADVDLDEVDEVPEGVPADLDALHEPDEQVNDGLDTSASDDAGDGTEEQEEDDENLVVVEVNVPEDGRIYETALLARDRRELGRSLGVGEDASRDDIAVELQRRLKLALEMGAPAA